MLNGLPYDDNQFITTESLSPVVLSIIYIGKYCQSIYGYSNIWCWIILTTLRLLFWQSLNEQINTTSSLTHCWNLEFDQKSSSLYRVGSIQNSIVLRFTSFINHLGCFDSCVYRSSRVPFGNCVTSSNTDTEIRRWFEYFRFLSDFSHTSPGFARFPRRDLEK